MKKKTIVWLIIAVVVWGLIIPAKTALAKELPRIPEAWLVEYISPDGSLDIYIYRHFHFPSGENPYAEATLKLNTDFKLYGRKLTYSDVEAFQTKILDGTDPLAIADIIRSGSCPKLETYYDTAEGLWAIKLPRSGDFAFVVHYRVGPEISAVGDDFARTYYRFPAILDADVPVKKLLIGLRLPGEPTCSGENYDEEDPNCPCFKVIHYIASDVESPGWVGEYQKTCDHILFTAQDVPADIIHELDAVYPPTLLSNAPQDIFVDQTWEEVKAQQISMVKGEEASKRAYQIKYLTEKSVFWAIVVDLISMLLASLSGKFKKGRIKLYYLQKIEAAGPSMELPGNPEDSAIYHPYHFGMALNGKLTYNEVAPEDIAKNNSLANLAQGVIGWLIFRLIRKGYLQPITDGDKLAGMRIVKENPEGLSPEEAKVFEALKSAALEREKKGLLDRFRTPDEAHIANERDDTHIITAGELKAFMNKPADKTYVNGKAIDIPYGIKLASEIVSAIHSRYSGPKPPYTDQPPIDMPRGIAIAALLESGMTSLMIGGIVWGLLAGAIAWALWKMLGSIPIPPMVWAVAPAVLGLGVFILIAMASKPDLGTWLHPKWWERFLGWERVALFIRNLTAIAEATPLQALNWDDYFEVASIRGLGDILTGALKKLKLDIPPERVAAYRTSTVFGTYAFYHAYHNFSSSYSKAVRSGTTSSGGHGSGTSFGGGMGGGGGSSGLR